MDYTNQLMANLFKAVAHPTRIRILRLLEPGPLCVCEILPQVDSEQSNTSQHLSVLKQSGVLTSRREGTRVIYSVADPAIYSLLHLAQGLVLRQIREASRRLSPEEEGADVRVDQ